jgi:hypothetical protein
MQGATNPYLLGPSGANVAGRGRVTLVSFGPLFLCGVLIAAAIAVGESAPLVTVALAIAAVLSFIAWPVVMWIWLIRGGRLLEAATRAWAAGDDSRALPAAHTALGTVFRGDIRARAFHLLGLVAEERADFDAAADLFARAERAIPSLAAPIRKRHARLLMGAHRAFCLVATGRVAEAAQVLQRLSYDAAQAGHSGVLDAFTDDATWGLGVVSANETLMNIEAGRHPRAVLALAWAFLHYAAGVPDQALRVLHAEKMVLDHGLRPHERALAQRIFVEVEGGGAEGADRWVDACVTGARRLVG